MSSKGFVSLICEYNPFHFGHLFQLEQLKKNFGAVVCIISGDIVQRGSVAIGDKYLRAEIAMKAGADLVLEHPIPWCCSSAKDFARAGVHIAHSIGGTQLAFGAEDSLDMLSEIVSVISRSDFAEKVKSLVAENKNLSYPAAMGKIVESLLGSQYAFAMGKPNNILGIEYLLAMKDRGMDAFVIKREPSFRSSSQIRSLSEINDILGAIPIQSREALEREAGNTFPRDIAKLDSFFIGSLRAIAIQNKDLSCLYAVPNDLLQKLLAESFHYSTVDSLVSACADKKYTNARVRRGINSIVFGIKAHNVSNLPPYTCVLGANSKGREILKSAKALNRIDIITKPVHALSKNENTKQAFLFAKGIEDIISLSSPVSYPADLGKTPFIIK